MNFIICKECSKKFKAITATHLKKHNLTVKEYKIKWNQTRVGIDRKFSNKHKSNISKSRRKGIEEGKIVPPNRGKKFSDDHKKNISISRKKAYREGRIIAWNKGLTKETDERILRLSKKSSKTQIERGIHKGINNHFYGKKHTKKTRELISKKAKISSEKKNPIFNILNNIKTKGTFPEIQFENILKSLNIKFEKQYKIFINDIKFRLYDFYLIDYNILIEIDSRYWHDKNYSRLNDIDKRVENDILKNDLAKNNGYRLIRIWDDELNKEWRII